MRKGDWLQTYKGIKFYPLEPKPEEILIEDIAHALSNQCRYSGHTREFYSVADHSVRVALALPKDIAFWGLLHDASEAYLHDIPTPLKYLPEFEFYREAEKKLQRMIYEKFGLTGDEPALLKKADANLLVTEARDLIPMIEPWSVTGKELSTTVIPQEPKAAEQSFLMMFYFLNENKLEGEL